MQSMAEPRRRQRWRVSVAGLLTVGIAAYALIDLDEGAPPPAAEGAHDVDASKLRIRDVSDAEVSPDDAVVVHYDGGDVICPSAPASARRTRGSWCDATSRSSCGSPLTSRRVECRFA